MIENPFVHRSHAPVVSTAPKFDPVVVFRLQHAYRCPKRCQRRSFAQPCQVGTFHRDLIGVGEVVEFVLPLGSNAVVAVSGITIRGGSPSTLDGVSRELAAGRHFRNKYLKHSRS